MHQHYAHSVWVKAGVPSGMNVAAEQLLISSLFAAFYLFQYGHGWFDQVGNYTKWFYCPEAQPRGTRCRNYFLWRERTLVISESAPPIAVVAKSCSRGMLPFLPAFVWVSKSSIFRTKQVLVHGLMHSFFVHLQCYHQIGTWFSTWNALFQPQISVQWLQRTFLNL